MSVNDLIAQATCAVLINGQVKGTAWLLSANGQLLSAGHLFCGDEPCEEVELRFVGESPLRARKILCHYDKGTGVDFAILQLGNPNSAHKPLPISLAEEFRGSFKAQGYGRTLKDLSPGTGEFIGSVALGNSPEFRLFRLRSPELGEGGYSGAAIFSEELQAVTAIQTEATTEKIGTGRDTVLALPLYRVARLWEPLLHIADQGKDNPENGYKYDVYLTYNRSPIIEQWIEESFVPQLEGRLQEELGQRKPDIFWNHNGVRNIWSEEMFKNVKRSRCFVAVTSTAYFAQALCRAELESFRRREEMLESVLGVPIEWQVSDNVPSDIRDRLISFSRYRYTEKGFHGSPIFVEFQQQVQTLVDQLTPILVSAPDYRVDFPVVAPELTILKAIATDTRIKRPRF